jgi:Saxitoxin biosynthesis operon protein SxtJ
MGQQNEAKQLRHFGLMVGGIFAAIGVWPALWSGRPLRPWALVLAVALMVPAIMMPRLLRQAYRGWMAVGELLGWINTRILLGLLFFAVVTPMGIVMRWLGRDPMQRAFDPRAETYRIPKPSRLGTHMTRQF